MIVLTGLVVSRREGRRAGGRDGGDEQRG